MEITNISGSDVMPSGFSAEAPRTEEAIQRETYSPQRAEPVPEENRGTVIDTYA